MSKITHDKEMGTGAFGMGRTMKFYLDGKEIGYWFCEGPLKSEHGTFHPNEYLKKILGDQSYAGGDIWKTMNTLQYSINKVTPVKP